MTDRRNKFIFGAARVYLLTFEGVNNNMIDKHLNLWKEGKRDSINDLLFGVLEAVKTRQGMQNAIGEIEQLRQYLQDFSPRQIIARYDNWKKLFRTIESNYNPPGRMAINIPQNYWRIFCKSVISASKFLSRFSNVEEFDRFVSQFYLNEYTRVALPLLLDKEIVGLGFALSCHFLKENGYPKFVKPDVHIKEIFKGIGISQSEADDYEVFKDVVRFSESINEIPYVVDKLFWLVGSGDFYLDELRIRTKRDDFIEEVKKEISLIWDR